MKNVGFIGLGHMGSRMCRRLVDAGFTIHVWDPTPQRMEPLVRMGAYASPSSRDLTNRTEFVVTMVSDDRALESVLTGDEGVLAGLHKGEIVVNMSTVSTDAVQRAFRAVESAGGHFVDAPVVGSTAAAAAGGLLILVAGEERILTQCKNVFGTLGRRTVRCGEIGQATRMKLVTNVLLGGMMELLGEALVLGKKMDLEPRLIADVIDDSPLACDLFRVKSETMLAGDFETRFSLDLMSQDLDHISKEADRLGVKMPTTETVREQYGSTQRQGRGQYDFSAVITILEEAAGITVRQG